VQSLAVQRHVEHEVLIVDDGSHDNSMTIASAHPLRARILGQSNSGSANRHAQDVLTQSKSQYPSDQHRAAGGLIALEGGRSQLMKHGRIFSKSIMRGIS
jgi:glycosyltransferase involved in cell wall biosynthesis